MAATESVALVLLRVESPGSGLEGGRLRCSVHAIEASCLRSSHSSRPSLPIVFLEKQESQDLFSTEMIVEAV